VEYLIIDGYNIIYTCPELERLEMEHARARLVEIMIDYSILAGQQIMVVFDAYGAKGPGERSLVVGGVEVFFTRFGETADSLIERLVGQLSKKGTVYVATSDWTEQRIIFGRGGYRITPAELWNQIKQARREGEKYYSRDLPAEKYLENRMLEEIRLELEKWRCEKE
jgi:hypothetical protein